MVTDEQESIILQVHNYVKQESVDFSEDDVFTNHVLGVRDYAITLAGKYDANLFVVTLAAYLHDIYHIQTHNHTIHEVEGAKFSEEYLQQFEIPNGEIGLIAKCILNHRGSKYRKRESIEEKIIASADAMDHITRIKHMFYRKAQKNSYEESVEWIIGKLNRGWDKIELSEGREIVKCRYDAAKITFGF